MPAFKNKSGIIPLFILIAVGIVFLAGGAYVVRNEFITKGKTGKPALNEQKVKQQIANPSILPSVSPEPEKQLAPVIYKYQPAETDQKSQPAKPGDTSSTPPGFTINPPAGWQQSSQSGIQVIFMSPDKDEEKAEDSLTYTQPANVQISFDYADNYNQLIAQGKTESEILDTILNNDIKKNAFGSRKISYITEQKTTFAGTDAYLLELNGETQYGVLEHVKAYLFVKNKWGFYISGHALDSAWSKRAGILNASLNTFRFTD